MNITNHEEKREESRLNIGQFASAIRDLNLGDIPPERRAQALQDHMLKIQVEELISPQARLGAAAALAIRKRIDREKSPRPIEIYTPD